MFQKLTVFVNNFEGMMTYPTHIRVIMVDAVMLTCSIVRPIFASFNYFLSFVGPICLKLPFKPNFFLFIIDLLGLLTTILIMTVSYLLNLSVPKDCLDKAK